MIPEELELCRGEIADLLDLEDGLSDWELRFIQSVGNQAEERGSLSEKQAAIVHKVWDKLCG